MTVTVTVDSEDNDQTQMRAVAAAVVLGLQDQQFQDVRFALRYPSLQEDEVHEHLEDYEIGAPRSLLDNIRGFAPELFLKPVMVVMPCKDLGGTTYETVWDSSTGGNEPDQDRRWPDLEPGYSPWAQHELMETMLDNRRIYDNGSLSLVENELGYRQHVRDQFGLPPGDVVGHTSAGSPIHLQDLTKQEIIDQVSRNVTRELREANPLLFRTPPPPSYPAVPMINREDEMVPVIMNGQRMHLPRWQVDSIKAGTLTDPTTFEPIPITELDH